MARENVAGTIARVMREFSRLKEKGLWSLQSASISGQRGETSVDRRRPTCGRRSGCRSCESKRRSDRIISGARASSLGDENSRDKETHAEEGDDRVEEQLRPGWVLAVGLTECEGFVAECSSHEHCEVRQSQLGALTVRRQVAHGTSPAKGTTRVDSRRYILFSAMHSRPYGQKYIAPPRA